MGLKKALATAILFVTRWKLVIEEEPPRTGSIMLGYPHTANIDAVYMICIAWSVDLKVKFLVKNAAMKAPFGWIVRAFGGVAVDRNNPGGLVEGLVEQIEKQQKDGESNRAWALVIAPEGTRSKTDHWKSGFYRIAMQTGLPVMLGFNDNRNRTLGLGPQYTMTGDVRADMDKIRAFYDGMVGMKAGNEGTMRLRMEDEGYKPE